MPFLASTDHPFHEGEAQPALPVEGATLADYAFFSFYGSSFS
jgi:hypothetical protein